MRVQREWHASQSPKAEESRMTYDWEKLNQIFHQALETAPDERAAFIRSRCEGDADLLDEALALLASHEEGEDFMETPLAGENLAGQFGDWQGRIVGAFEGDEQVASRTRQADYLTGKVIDGKYLIEERRGQGGMGAVYRATHQGTGRRVAIKIIAPEFMANPEFVERFKREAKAAGMLNHPNVVNVTDFGLSAQAGAHAVAYLVMEYLEGLTLADLLKDKKGLPLEQVVSILEQVCRAIDEAHRTGILHRDLKPENIWLEPLKHGGYQVKVLDFGLAKLRDVTPDEASSVISTPPPASALPNRTRLLTDDEAHTLLRVFSAPLTPPPETSASGDEREALKPQDEAAESALTRPTIGHMDTRTAPHWFSRTGMVLGTPTYMSPEQCRGERLDTSSDIYSLGVIAYQMLAGEAPFAGTTLDLLSKHKEMPPPPLAEKRPGLPVGVSEVLGGALSKERAGRPATAGAFACALRLGAEGESAIRKEAGALYQKHRWLFLKTAALVHAPIIAFAMLLLLGAVLLPVMSPTVSLVVFSLLWLVMLFLTLYGNAATTAACTLLIEQLPDAAQSSGTVKTIARRVIGESALLARAVYSGASDAVRKLLSLHRSGWRAYFDSLLLVPLAITEKISGQLALDRAKKLSAHVRRLALDIRALHLASALFTLLVYQLALVTLGILTDIIARMPPRPPLVNSFVILLPFMALLAFCVNLLQVRTGIEHAVLYLKAREIEGERVGGATELAAPASAPKLVRPRIEHGRAIALASVLVFAVSGWQLLKRELMASSVEDGSINLVKAFNASGVSVPFWSNDYHPDVGRIMQQGTPIIELLLEKGADVNARVMLDRGWTPPYKTDSTTTPLLSAISVDSPQSARTLLEHGADIHAQDSGNRTALMIAATYSPATIDLLLSYGANINEQTGKGTALLCAARYRGLFDGSTITAEDLHPRQNVVARLLERGADVNARDEEGRTALMLISMEYRPDRIILPMAEALLKGSADINARDRNARTPLMYAVRHKQRATVDFLLRHGADLSAQDSNGETALDLATRLGFTDIARTLSAAESDNPR